jgi:hypothetical protein
MENLLRLPEVLQAATGLHMREQSLVADIRARVAWDEASGKKSSQPPAKAPVLVDVHLKDVSLQDAFNAVAEAYGHTMWWYRQMACGAEVTYRVEVGQSQPTF